MTFLKRSAFLVAIFTILTGCAAMPAASSKSLAEYPYRHNGFDFKIGWKTVLAQQGLAIDGIMQNVRYPQVQDLEVTVSLVNAQNKVLAEATTFPIPSPVTIDQYRDFNLVLKNATPTQGDLLRFRIEYLVVDDDRSSFKWITLFTVDALTGAEIARPEEMKTR